MFKRKLVVVIALFAALCACASQALTVHELVNTADQKANSAKSYEMTYDTTLDMNVQGTSNKVTTVSKAKYIADPILLSMTSSVKVLDKTVKVDTYMQIEGDDMVMYTVQDKKVTKQVLPLSDDLRAQIKSQVSPDFLNSYKSLEYVGSKKLNNKKVHVVNATISASYLSDQLKTALSGMDLAKSFGNLDKLSDLTVVMYIDAKTNMYARMEFDMTDLMNAVLKSMPELSDVTVDKYFMSMNFSKFDAVKKFTIPASVIKAAG